MRSEMGAREEALVQEELRSQVAQAKLGEKVAPGIAGKEQLSLRPPETPQFTASILETPTQLSLQVRPHLSFEEDQQNHNELNSSVASSAVNVDSMQAKLEAIRRSKAALEAKMRVYDRIR